jgi:hypothetical protein
MSTATTIENRPARASSSISAQRVPARRFFVADTAVVIVDLDDHCQSLASASALIFCS